MTYKYSFVTIFPKMCMDALEYGVIGRAVKNNIVDFDSINPRDFTDDTRHTVDERPIGGGPGMVMMVEPLHRAIQYAKRYNPNIKVVFLSPQGKQFTQAKALELASEKEIIFVCGRYEGIDERLIELDIDEEISIGDYVLSGGELPALVVVDAIIRLIPDVLNKKDSFDNDSFMNGLLDYPNYTKPYVYENKSVPQILLSGHHEKIRKWRMQEALHATLIKRPDLLEKLALTDEQKQMLENIKLDNDQLYLDKDF